MKFKAGNMVCAGKCGLLNVICLLFLLIDFSDMEWPSVVSIHNIVLSVYYKKPISKEKLKAQPRVNDDRKTFSGISYNLEAGNTACFHTGYVADEDKQYRSMSVLLTANTASAVKRCVAELDVLSKKISTE